VGWRLWRIHGRGLYSWGLDHRWTPGPNRAKCLTGIGQGCQVAPGAGCHCGFWGLWDPATCVAKARDDGYVKAMIGLMAGWGTVAMHGDEGFRAERASVLCLFRDQVCYGAFRRVLDPEPRRRPATRLFEIAHRVAPGPPGLPGVASDFGIPVLWLRDAVRLGVLAELGVDAGVQARIGDRLGPVPSPRPGGGGSRA
jgi:hypothetical protein